MWFQVGEKLPRSPRESARQPVPCCVAYVVHSWPLMSITSGVFLKAVR